MGAVDTAWASSGRSTCSSAPSPRSSSTTTSRTGSARTGCPCSMPRASPGVRRGATRGSWLASGPPVGHPLIAGDPHRDHRAARLLPADRAGLREFDVVGFAFPGVPGVQHFAHAGSVAWGITNAMADYQDLTREELRRRDDDCLEARGVAGWAPVTHYLETVRVRGADPIEVPVVVTERGPVVTGLEAGLEAALSRGPAAGVAGRRRRLLQPAHAVAGEPRPRIRGLPAAPQVPDGGRRRSRR